MTIVDQIKVLKTSFEDDKQSAIEDEARLQGLYDKLMQTKSESLATLKSDRDATQSRLVQTQQDIAENEGSKSRADRELADTQSHLSQVTKTRDETLEAYEIRKKDREASLPRPKCQGGQGGRTSSATAVSDLRARRQ